MSAQPRVGTIFAPTRPIAELPEAARQAEQLGFEEFWLAEDCFLHGGLTAAAIVLAGTERLAVGVGLLPAAVRNAAIAAMELATLANLYPGRVIPAFGHGVESWMRQIGARPRDRIIALQEVVGSTRALLAGETLTVDGRFVTLDEVALDQPPPEPPPLLVGTTGERGIAVARDAADGLVLPEGSGESAVAWASELLGPGRPVVVYTWLSVEDDGAAAREALLPTVRKWRDAGMYTNLIRLARLADGAELGRAEIDRVAIAGSPDECAAAIARLGEAGASSVILRPIGGDPATQLECVARDVLPLVRR